MISWHREGDVGTEVGAAGGTTWGPLGDLVMALRLAQSHCSRATLPGDQDGDE